MKKYIKELNSKIDEKILLDIVKYEDKIFGEGSIGLWNIKPFSKYGKIFGMLTENSEIISVIEVLSSFDREKVYIYGLFTVEKYENKGYASELLDYVLKYLKKQGVKYVELTVDIKNKFAIKLYENKRFRIVEILENEYGDGNERYLMRCDIEFY